jgi:hypothetical protein
MLKVLTVMGEGFKSIFMAVAAQALNGIVNNPAELQRANAAVGAALSDVHVPTAVAASVIDLLPHAVATFTPDEAVSAAIQWCAADTANTTAAPVDAFLAGAQWSVSHVGETLTGNLAMQVAANHPATASLIADAEKIAIDVASGNNVGAAADIVGDVVQIAEEKLAPVAAS